MEGSTVSESTRRRFLGTAGLTTVALAGCVDILGGQSDDEDESDEDESDTPESTERFVLDFEDPPEALQPHVEQVDGTPKLVIRDEEVTYSLPDLSGWQRIEYRITGQSAGNTVINLDSAADGNYRSFVGIRPWMRFPSAVEGFNGASTYPGSEFEDARSDTEYRVVIDRTGSATGALTVYGPDGDSEFTLEQETVFDVFDGTDEATFAPETVRFISNKSSERAVFGDLVVE